MQSAQAQDQRRQDASSSKNTDSKASACKASACKASACKASACKAMELLEEGISRITDTAEFKRYLSFIRSFRHYSANNTMLIFLQRPDATMVAGYKKWLEYGRQVRKAEKAIKILAPVVRKETDEDTGEELRRVVGFRDANVFAYESTEGEPIPSPPLTGPVRGDRDAAEELYELLMGICVREGVEVKEERLGRGHYGGHDPIRGRIVLSTELSVVRKATTLTHELCHHLLHPLRASIELDTPTKETEAEGASFAICDHFGIDTSAFSFPYVARHAKDPKTLQGVFERIQKVVGRVLDEAEKSHQPADDNEAQAA